VSRRGSDAERTDAVEDPQMSQTHSIVQQIIREIDRLHGPGVPDYRGRLISAEHVKHYFFSSYHRTREIVRRLSRIGAGKKILDIGIGYGFYDIILKEDFGFDVTGMEVEKNIPAYCLLPRAHGIPLVAGELCKHPCPISDRSFDVVILAEVLEHLRVSPMRVLLEIRRILRPGGAVLVTTPNMARLTNVLRLLLGRNVVEALPDDDTNLAHITDEVAHLREYTMAELRALMARAGYRNIKGDYSLCVDRVPPEGDAGWAGTAVRLALLPALAVVRPWRSCLFIVGQTES
jgi:2-polyprenyl-3-methyl-5-hydroxy-6-metoxy-1,4-benzoquinol methylase